MLLFRKAFLLDIWNFNYNKKEALFEAISVDFKQLLNTFQKFTNLFIEQEKIQKFSIVIMDQKLQNMKQNFIFMKVPA